MKKLLLTIGVASLALSAPGFANGFHWHDYNKFNINTYLNNFFSANNYSELNCYLPQNICVDWDKCFESNKGFNWLDCFDYKYKFDWNLFCDRIDYKNWCQPVVCPPPDCNPPSVPDGGATLLLLGGSLTAFALLRRRLTRA